MEENTASIEAPIEEDSVVMKAARACSNMTTVSECTADVEKNHLKDIMSVINRDMTATDVKWSLFVAACQNYRQDSCLRPFPHQFLADGNKDFAALAKAVESVPPFSQLESSIQTLPKAAVELLHWVLIGLDGPSLTTVSKAGVPSVLGLVPFELSAPPPSLVMRVNYQPSSAVELRWEKLRRKYGSVHAFHGSKLENFHSILQHGLQQHLTKHALFGQGVYLSSELLVCLPYSRNGLGWTNSCVGGLLSVMALCEILDHPSVYCQVEGDETNKSRARAEDSLVGDIPHTFYVVPNSDHLRLRYLLLYTMQPPVLIQQQLSNPNSSLVSWFGSHKVTVSLIVYVVMLVSIGLSRNPTVIRYWQNFCRSLGFHY